MTISGCFLLARRGNEKPNCLTPGVLYKSTKAAHAIIGARTSTRTLPGATRESNGFPDRRAKPWLEDFFFGCTAFTTPSIDCPNRFDATNRTSRLAERVDIVKEKRPRWIANWGWMDGFLMAEACWRVEDTGCT